VGGLALQLVDVLLLLLGVEERVLDGLLALRGCLLDSILLHWNRINLPLADSNIRRRFQNLWGRRRPNRILRIEGNCRIDLQETRVTLGEAHDAVINLNEFTLPNGAALDAQLEVEVAISQMIKRRATREAGLLGSSETSARYFGHGRLVLALDIVEVLDIKLLVQVNHGDLLHLLGGHLLGVAAVLLLEADLGQGDVLDCIVVELGNGREDDIPFNSFLKMVPQERHLLMLQLIAPEELLNSLLDRNIVLAHRWERLRLLLPPLLVKVLEGGLLQLLLLVVQQGVELSGE